MADAINQHKKMAMGQNPKESPSPKTGYKNGGAVKAGPPKKFSTASKMKAFKKK